MRKRLFLILALLIYTFPIFGQCSLYELSLENKIEHSSLIIEGIVVNQMAFQDRHSGRIYTANTIEVYKVFKGDVSTDQIILLTEGGRLGAYIYKLEPSLSLEIGQAGIFFCENTSQSRKASPPTILQYKAYGSLQGFIRYDVSRRIAATPFKVYADIEKDLYLPIQEMLGLNFQEVRSYQMADKSHGLSGTRMVPVIDNFTPISLSAGTQSILTINGSNFEAYDGGISSVVSFSNANDGGLTFVDCPASEILSWNDTQITLFLPSAAGTGVFSVQNASGNASISAAAISIPFSHGNVTGAGAERERLLQDENGAGGYTLSFSTNTADNGIDFQSSAAFSPFDLALSNWQNATALNIISGGTTNINIIDGADGVHTIMFDNDADPLSPGTLAQTSSTFLSCDGGFTWHVIDIDLRFRRDGTGGISWNFDTGNTGLCCYDFQSVALHELGHAHQLNHIIANGNVMHFAIANGSDIRTLDANSDIAGGDYVMTQSAALNTCGGSITGMVPFTPFPLELLHFEAIVNKNYNRITWQVVSDWQQQGFELERSDDAITFQAIVFIESQDPSTPLQTYFYDDRNLSQATHYYRLKRLDFNAEVHYSEIVEVYNPSLPSMLQLFPSPSSRLLHLSLGKRLGREEMVYIQIFDLQGRSVMKQQGYLNEGEIQLSVAALSPGIYYLNLLTSGGNIRYRAKVVKQ